MQRNEEMELQLTSKEPKTTRSPTLEEVEGIIGKLKNEITNELIKSGEPVNTYTIYRFQTGI